MPTLLGYIFRTIQRFAAKLVHYTKFSMLFSEISVSPTKLKVSLLCKRSIAFHKSRLSYSHTKRGPLLLNLIRTSKLSSCLIAIELVQFLSEQRSFFGRYSLNDGYAISLNQAQICQINIHIRHVSKTLRLLRVIWVLPDRNE